jgi:hypothetical protein
MRLKVSQVLPQTKAKPKAKAKSQGEGIKGTGPGKSGDKSKGKSKGDGKGKDNQKGSEPAAQPKAAPKAKSSIPCLFYPKGTCNKGDDCPFLHDAKAAPAAKAKSLAATAKATVAFVAAASSMPKASAVSTAAVKETLKKSAWATFKSSICAFVQPFLTLMSLTSGIGDPQGFASAAILCNPNVTIPQVFASQTSGATVRNQDFDDIKVLTPGIPAILSHTHAVPAQSTSPTTVDLEWIADSGAGRDLESERAFLQQGIPKDTIQSCISGIHPTKFETGNGPFTSDTCIELQGESFGQARFNMMNDYPLVRSLGQIVSSGKPFVWMPGERIFLPILVMMCK